MAVTRLNLTRDQLASFLNDHEQIKQFEKLFEVADMVIDAPDTLGISIAADNADSKATQALTQLERIADSLALLAAAPAQQNNNSLITDYLDFNRVGPHAGVPKRLAWNLVDETLDVHMENGVTQQVGLEQYARVSNTSGATIPNGSVVGFAGATDFSIIVTPFLANGAQPNAAYIGVMTHDLINGATGYVTVRGFIRDLDTSAYSVGTLLYASPSVAGAFTSTKPSQPNNVILFGVVTKVGVSDGVIAIRAPVPQQMYYGTFSKTTNQSPAVVNTAYALTLDNTLLANGIAIGAPTSRLVVTNSGFYLVAVNVQITSGSASTKTVWMWFRLNGVDVASSARLVTSDINGGYVTLVLQQSFVFAAGDYFEVYFGADDTNVTVGNVAATGFAPAAPAMRVQVLQIQP